MTTVVNTWIVTSKNNKLHNLYKVLLDNEGRESIQALLSQNVEDSLQSNDILTERSPKSLIEGDPYFYKTDRNNPESLKALGLEEFYTKVVDNYEALRTSDVITFRKNLQEYNADSERPRFYIFEIKRNDEQLFAYAQIDSKALVRKRKLLEWNASLNKSSAVIDITEGVPLPSNITAIFEATSDKLYVYTPFSFEKMLFIHEAAKLKANENIQKFIRGEFTIGNEGYNIKGLDQTVVSSKILKSSRSINRIAKYTASESLESVRTIENVMTLLPNENDKLQFNHTESIVVVNQDNYKTFVAVIHDSIVKRLISGEVQII
ncbi:Kiwa anti-phage protein KwaB-like domain-containing protein [Cohnella fermenti]|uniref:Kiwa anti-phage protein KwaB-like domain-containing protein n=1 Tax=Cohnella fermenti TaxID=2565925 RepID=UPI001454CE34|nr:Kiwa anti-phage protein KwaB-like domain-containing protein [Cohnella fermenti]